MSIFFGTDSKEKVLEKRREARRRGVFVSRASIFEYLIFEEGLSREEAEAESESWARCLGLPDKIEKQPEGVQKWISHFNELSVVVKENPHMVEIATGAISALMGVFAGAFVAKEAEQHIPPMPDYLEKLNEPIPAIRLSDIEEPLQIENNNTQL